MHTLTSSFRNSPLGKAALNVGGLAALGLLAFAPTVAHAQTGNIVLDGSFEKGTNGFHSADGSFGPAALGDGWTVAAGTAYVTGTTYDALPYAQTGTQSLDLTPYLGVNPTPISSSIVSQTLATVAGQTYDLSFAADGHHANTFSVLINGVALAGTPVSIPVNGSDGHPAYSPFGTQASPLTFTAASSSTVLSFMGAGSGNAVFVDDVSVTPASAPVPEASTTVSLGLMLALGLGGVVIAAKRKKVGAQA